MEPVAHIRSGFKDKFGIPRQSGRVMSLVSRIVFEPQYRNPDSLRGIEGFSHIWLIFDFSEAHRDGWSPTVRPPRLGGNRRVGVFASRSPFRPNNIGLSAVRLLGVEHTRDEGDVLVVAGADLLDGTPVYDIKPYLPFSDCHPDAVGGYADAQAEHRLEIYDPEGVAAAIPDGIRGTILDCIADDPRPSYQNDPGRIYGMRYADCEITFRIEESRAVLVSFTGAAQWKNHILADEK